MKAKGRLIHQLSAHPTPDPRKKKGRLRDLIPSPLDPRFTKHTLEPLPSWLDELRAHQWKAVREAVRLYEEGCKVVWVDAPTGSGKTLLAELVAREMQERALYLCTTKSLQEQVLRDYSYARVLKGRANYLTLSGALDVTCADCDRGPAGVPLEDQECTYCEPMECPYIEAKMRALGSNLAVLNTAYFLNEANWVGEFSKQELVVVDEVDLLERELLGFVSLELTETMLSKLGLTAPTKGSHMATIWRWLEEEVKPALADAAAAGRRRGGIEARREVKRLERLQGQVTRVIRRPDGWVRDYPWTRADPEGARSVILKPVRVDDVAKDLIWRHGERFLCMTGSLVSAEIEAEGLGLDEDEWGVVEVPMTFPLAHRPVVAVPVANMTRSLEAKETPKLIEGLECVLRRHEGVNVLVHTHSYKLAKSVVEGVERSGDTRPIITYTQARERDAALARFKRCADKGGAILVASSMDRGIDLPGDLCRVQVVCKMPYPSLGDRQVAERARGRGGDLWYGMQTVRGVLQMTGRIVRSSDDWGVTYILDRQFMKVYKERKGMFPAWWRDGVTTERVNRWLRET